MKKMTLLTLGAALIAGPAFAAPGGGRNMGDADGDGVLTRAEAQAAATQMFTKMDVNQDGKIDAADHAEQKAKREASGNAAEGKRRHRGGRGGHGMMMKADTDGDKAISQAEFEAAALARFDRLDANKDGQVTAEERQAQRDAWKAKRGERSATPAAPATE